MRHLAGGLDRVAVKSDAGFTGDLAYLGDGLDGADLVVCVHDGNQDRIGPDRLAHVLRIHPAATIHRHPGQLVSAFLQVLHGLEHGVVLYGGGDEMAALLLLRIRRPGDGPVVGFGAPAREVDLVGLRPDRGGYRLTGLLHRACRCESQAIDSGGIAKLFTEPGAHRLDDLGVGGRRGGVIEIHCLIHETSLDGQAGSSLWCAVAPAPFPADLGRFLSVSCALVAANRMAQSGHMSWHSLQELQASGLAR
jgi:hypothetical protein